MKRPALLAAGAALLGALPFLPALAHGFIWDDFQLLIDNGAWRGLGLGQLRWMATSLYMTTYQPLGWLAYDLIYLLQGMDPRGFHGANLAAHMLNGYLLARLANGMLRESKSGVPEETATAAGAMAGLLWMVHPAQVESVGWITQLPDILATTCVLLSLRAYLERKSAASAALFLASALFRWKGLSLPFWLIAVDLVVLRRRHELRLWLEKAPFFAVAAAFALVNGAAKGQIAGIAAPPGLGVVASGLAFYVQQLIVPSGLTPYYTLNGSWRALAVGSAAGAGLVLALSAALAALRSGRRAPAAAWACFCAALLPTFAASHDGLVFAQDHYLYLASIPLALLAAAGLARARAALPPAMIAAPGAFALALAFSWALAARAQTRIWQSSIALWSQALFTDDAHRLAHGNLAAALLEQGRLVEAVAHMERQAALRPDDAWARGQLSGMRLAGKNALRLADDQPEGSPNDAHPPYSALAEGPVADLLTIGKHNEALALAGRQLHAAPGSRSRRLPAALTARRNAAAALAARGRLAEAVRQLEAINAP